MMEWMIDVAMLVAALLVLVASTYAYWRKWQTADADERQAMLAKAVKELVVDAERQYVRPKAGTAKFSWVMNRLQKRFPGVEWETLGEYVEQAVLHLNASQAARQGSARQNGKHDA